MTTPRLEIAADDALQDVAPLTVERAAAALADRAGSMTAAQAARFLNQATFGATIAMIDQVRRETPAAWVERQFTVQISNSYGSAAARLVDMTTTFDRNKVFGKRSHIDLNVNMVWRPYVAYQPNQLRRRVGAALAEIFVLNSRVAAIGLKNNIRATAAYMDMLEANAFGNFRDILMATSRSPAMGEFLSFRNNQKAVYDRDGHAIRMPDENYAREIMQLFSIGLYELNPNGTYKLDGRNDPIPTYTQDDVVNLARVFTGLVLAGQQDFVSPLAVDAANHSPEAATFLDTTIPAGTPTLQAINRAVDALFKHPNVGPFIGKQLIQRLVTSNPSPAYVRRVALAFNDNGRGTRGDMKAVIRAILLDQEALTPATPSALAHVQGKVREPMLRLTAVARLLGAQSSNPVFPIGDLSDAFTGIGQSPLKSPSVFNFFRPGYTPPNSAIADGGWVAPEFQILDGSAILSGINVINDFIDKAPQYFDIDTTYLASVSASASDLVDTVALVLTASTLDTASRADFIDIVGAIPASNQWGRIRTAIQLVASSPAFLIQK